MNGNGKGSEFGVRIWEELLVIPTYQVGDPDLNSIFYSGRAYQGAQGHVYPYPMLDIHGYPLSFTVE